MYMPVTAGGTSNLRPPLWTHGVSHDCPWKVDSLNGNQCHKEAPPPPPTAPTAGVEVASVGHSDGELWELCTPPCGTGPSLDSVARGLGSVKYFKHDAISARVSQGFDSLPKKWLPSNR